MGYLARMLMVMIAITVCTGCMIMDPTAGRPPIEPGASEWGTWFLATNDELRPNSPPDAEATASELVQLQEIVASVSEEDRASVVYWDAGSPLYRWVEIAANQYRSGPPSPAAARGLALVNVALYDATIATWDAKYAYNRAHPTSVSTLVEVPNSPSYPSEHAAAAGAASVVLSYLFPDSAEFFATQAEEAAQSRVLAGVHYPSDIQAGLTLGRAVGEKVVALAETDGFTTEWTEEIPTGPGLWQGVNPVTPLAGTWRTWALSGGDQFRAPAPPAHDSEQVQTELATIREVERTPDLLLESFFRRSITGSYIYWMELAAKRINEYHLDRNPPWAALVYSAMSVASYDSVVACFDSKYAYWFIRPSQLDSTIQPLFAVPNHPSYPAAHSCNAYASAAVLAGFFPAEAEEMLATAHRAGDSRVWAGIHYPMDIDAGETIGEAVAATVLARVAEMTQE